MMNLINVLIIFLVILFSMTLHEAMHAFAGYFLGDDIAKQEGRLTLNPIKHIDPFMTIILPLTLAVVGAPIFGGAKPVPFNPNRVKGGEWGAAFVAIAGPLTNLLIAFIFFGVNVILAPSDEFILLILRTIVMVNLGFFAFNILPIPPLDGSRVLYAVAPASLQKIMENIERYGVMLIFFIVFVASSIINKIIVVIIETVLALFALIYHLGF